MQSYFELYSVPLTNLDMCLMRKVPLLMLLASQGQEIPDPGFRTFVKLHLTPTLHTKKRKNILRSIIERSNTPLRVIAIELSI